MGEIGNGLRLIMIEGMDVVLLVGEAMELRCFSWWEEQ